MSTRGVIARATETGFKGVYHHWDSYPTALGNTLWHLYREEFNCDIDKMLAELIDKHPAGWSTIISKRECFCHDRGEGKESAWEVTNENASESGCEWAYVFDGNNMEVQCSYRQNGAKMIGAFGCGDPDAIWRSVATIDLNKDEEPNWNEITE